MIDTLSLEDSILRLGVLAVIAVGVNCSLRSSRGTSAER